MNQPDNMTLQGTLEKRRNIKKASSLAENFSKPGRWSVLLVVIMAPWMFGSVHHWAQYLISIALLVGLGFWWFETAMNNRKHQMVPYVAVFVLAGILLGLFQLFPLPGFLADTVLGRQTDIYQEFSGDSTRRPSVSLDPQGTWGQLQLLSIALATLLLGCRYFRTTQDMILLLVVCAANGALLSFFGIVQKLTYDGQIFWTYPVLAGNPFGPFVNRNNAAGYLLMTLACCIGLIPIVLSVRKTTGPVPIISKEMPFWRQFYFYVLFFISELTATKIGVILSTVLVAAGIVGSASRGGGLAMLVGAVITIVFYGVARKPKNLSLLLVPLGLMLALLTGWIGLSDQLLSRIERTDLTNVSQMEGRFQSWRDTWPAVADMGWFGSGLGSYRHVHRLYNTEVENGLYMYAENQFFQSLVEAGWPGFVLFALAWLLAFRYSTLLLFQGQSPSSIGVGTFGVFLLTSQATASFFDFGLYVPANMVVMAVLVGMLAYQAQAMGGRLKKRNWLRFECPNFVVQFLLLALFAGLTMTALDLYRHSRLDFAMTTAVDDFNQESPSLSETDQKIKELEPLVARTPDVRGLNYLAELWIHRSRLAYFAFIQKDEEFHNSLTLLDDEERKEMIDRYWDSTTIQRMQENGFHLRRSMSRFQASRFFNSPFIRENLPQAAQFFAYSRSQSPLQPVVHLRLGQIIGVLGAQADSRLGDVNVERAIKLAPSNPKYRMFAGLYYLQSGNSLAAAPHFRKYLELVPRQFTLVMQLLAGRTDHRVEPVGLPVLLESVIPDDPRMLFEMAKNWTGGDAETKRLALEKADDLLGETMPVRDVEILLRADIRLEKGDKDLAVEAMRAALKGNPGDLKTQLRLAELLLDQQKLEEAMEEAKKLLRFNSRNQSYNALIKKIETAIENQTKIQ